MTISSRKIFNLTYEYLPVNPGGLAVNTGSEFDATNSTRLKILVTSPPHISEFKTDELMNLQLLGGKQLRISV